MPSWHAYSIEGDLVEVREPPNEVRECPGTEAVSIRLLSSRMRSGLHCRGGVGHGVRTDSDMSKFHAHTG